MLSNTPTSPVSYYPDTPPTINNGAIAMHFCNISPGSRFIHVQDLLNAEGKFITLSTIEVFTKICVVQSGGPNAIGVGGRLADFDDECSVIALEE